MGPNDDWTTFGVDADLDALVGLALVENIHVVFEHRLDQFRDTFATHALEDEIRFILDREQKHLRPLPRSLSPARTRGRFRHSRRTLRYARRYRGPHTPLRPLTLLTPGGSTVTA